MKNRIRLFLAFLLIFPISGAPAVVLAAEQGRYFINIGADPVDPFRQVNWGSEFVAPLTENTELSSRVHSGPWVRGWVHKGLRVVIPLSGDGTEGWILDCGNPFKSAKPLPLGPRQLTPQALPPATASTAAASVPREVNVKGIPTEINLNVNNGQPVQVQVAPVTLVTDPNHPLQVVVVKAKKKKQKEAAQAEEKGGGRCGKKCKAALIAVAAFGAAAAIALPILLGGHAAPPGGPSAQVPNGPASQPGNGPH